MDLNEICDQLRERYPQWSNRINRLEFKDVTGYRPVDNDGRCIFYDRLAMENYSLDSQCFYIAQQLIHLQLAHYSRGQDKSPKIWKMASDAVVNAMLKADGFQSPSDAVYVQDAEGMCAEQLYDILLPQCNGEEDDVINQKIPQKKQAKNANNQAGKSSEGLSREIEDPGFAAVVTGLMDSLEPCLQLDYDWFPGSTIRDGVLGYEFRAYPVTHAEILLDTSASVDGEMLRAFVRGVKGLMQQEAVLKVGCFDTKFYGFQEVQTEQDIQNLELQGAGGTNFSVAINAFTGDAENRIIFTDGFAEMPEQRCDAVWVVYGNTSIHPPGGRILYVKLNEEKEKHEVDFLIT